MEYLALNNGIQMPLAGFGTFMLKKKPVQMQSQQPSKLAIG